MRPTGVKTNGVDNPSSFHLNLTKTMAEAIAAEAERHDKFVTNTKRCYERQNDAKHAYAGKEMS